MRFIQSILLAAICFVVAGCVSGFPGLPESVLYLDPHSPLPRAFAHDPRFQQSSQPSIAYAFYTGGTVIAHISPHAGGHSFSVRGFSPLGQSTGIHERYVFYIRFGTVEDRYEQFHGQQTIRVITTP